MVTTQIGTNIECLAKNLKVSKFYDRKLLMFARFEKSNIEILIQMQKIRNIDFEFRAKGLFTHQRSKKRAKNLQGTSNFHRKRELIA